MLGILGKKLGMTHIYDETGKMTPVTLIEAEPSLVMGLCTVEKNGYSSIMLGIGERKKATKNKPKKMFIKEIRLNNKATNKIGDLISVDMFREGDHVDITGITKGKGFQGGMKRWGWRGGEGGHGSMHHRRVGSIGASSFPSRVHKGKTMPGHMGSVKKTVQNLKVVKVDKAGNMLAVAGSIPGANNSYLVIKEAIKIPIKRQELKEEK